MANTATVRSGAWYGDREIDLHFPANWQVEMLNQKDAPALSDHSLNKHLPNPSAQNVYQNSQKVKRVLPSS